MLPSMAYLYVSPVEMTEYLDTTLGHWSKFEGLDYTPMAKVYSQMLLEKPLVETIRAEQLIDDEKMLASFDLKDCTLDDLKSVQAYNVEFTSSRDSARLHGFAFWFDVVFRCDNDECVYLRTSPASEPTHWKQTVTFLPQAVTEYVDNSHKTSSSMASSRESKLVLNAGDSFECYVLMNQCENNPRSYEIDIGVDLNPGKEGEKDNQEEEEEEEEEEYDDDDDDDEEEDDQKLHPIPCNCGNIKCILIKATLEKYQNEAK